jgi:hypothetical protein
MFQCRVKASVRWSFAVPFLLYVSLFGMTWMLALPLKSLPQQTVSTYDRKAVAELPNHLDGIRLGRGGDINTGFRKEAIIGDVNEGPQFEDPRALLENIFNR